MILPDNNMIILIINNSKQLRVFKMFSPQDMINSWCSRYIDQHVLIMVEAGYWKITLCPMNYYLLVKKKKKKKRKKKEKRKEKEPVRWTRGQSFSTPSPMVLIWSPGPSEPGSPLWGPWTSVSAHQGSNFHHMSHHSTSQHRTGETSHVTLLIVMRLVLENSWNVYTKMLIVKQLNCSLL